MTRPPETSRANTRISAHDPSWATGFAEEARAIAAALGPGLARLHHIGSTSVPGLPAKPIIDMLAEAPSLDALDHATPTLEALGYQAMGAFGIEGRLYFRKSRPDGIRTHHLHAFQSGSAHIRRHLAFRDYLIAHPDVLAAYGDLKLRLVSDPRIGWDSYMDGKAEFVAETERAALAWVDSRN